MADENKDRAEETKSASGTATSPAGGNVSGKAGASEEGGKRESGSGGTKESGTGRGASIGEQVAQSAADIAAATEGAADAAEWTYRQARDTVRDSRAVIRGQVFERPLLSVTAVGLIGFALGWICRGSQASTHYHRHGRSRYR